MGSILARGPIVVDDEFSSTVVHGLNLDMCMIST